MSFASLSFSMVQKIPLEQEPSLSTVLAASTVYMNLLYTILTVYKYYTPSLTNI